MNIERINKTAEFIKGELIKWANCCGNNLRSAQYRIEHSFRVANIGAHIARAEGFDVEKTVIACLLHDIGYSTELTEENYRNHGRIGANIARSFLQTLDFSKEDIDEMCFGIAIHVDDRADFEGERTPLSLTVGDSDNIDRYDAYRLYEGLHLSGYMDLELEKQKEYLHLRLSRLLELKKLPCGTKTGEQLWNEKIDFQIRFYEQLLRQTESSENIVIV